MPTSSDVIFLLSLEEYLKYKDKIPLIDESWWLRTPGKTSEGEKSDLVACVNKYGSIAMSANVIGRRAVRPAIRTNWVEEKVNAYGFDWLKIDNNLYIAETPIAHRNFDEYCSIRDLTNQYNSSTIKRFLTYWLQKRKNGDK